MNKKEKLSEIIRNSTLNDFDKNMWFVFIQSVNDEQIIPLLELLREDTTENLEIITHNLKQKIKLAGNNHLKNAQEIVDEELKIIEEKLSKE
ncbi:MAG: hypothetical protein COX29_02550 [Candidatus Moranbacteria bacterium CG23_combo_of_CG06-09_8_20_14_all_35_22]|nr:MAG: hypothetical protein COX29_02550 [Candidatus Moranbacteria bacterium CG23_combo_of_CG06-09_8_20_14_all_35_22]